ncbi:MAG: tetratricopeptide repeat protein [Pyrinomonadaceae bacterium]
MWSVLNRGESDRAIEYFRRALAFPATTWHLVDYEDCLANAFLQLGRYDEAISEYQRILSINPHYPRAQYFLARAFEAKGDVDQARSSYGSFLETWKYADHNIPEVVSTRKYLEQ